MRRMWARYRGLSTKWQVAIGVVLGLAVIGAVSPSDDGNTKVKIEDAASSSPTSEATATTAAVAPTTPTTAPATTTVPPTTTTTPPTTAPPTTEPPAPRASVSQQNARAKAESYLGFMAFSRQGLIDQLKFDGFNDADAAYGVDAANPDWNEQAAKKAASYLDFMSFSHSGLVEQLVFDGFTPAQAEYGVGTTGL